MYSGDFNFRYRVYPDYKHNRIDKEKPELYYVLKEHILNEHPVEPPWKGIEADDTLGILGSQDPDGCIVCTIDKDLYTIPCRLYNWNKMGKPQMVTVTEADWFWMYQVLTGDTCDGYKGCPMIGDKKARKILEGLEDLRDMWAAVVETYLAVSPKQAQKAYGKDSLTEEDAIVQAQIARILRVEDWDFKKQKPILWRPDEITR